ncbi:hypothetical protein F4553_000738 [Allocatelliglobosispora scoriae]|uniref:Uncharacterized protein n=1 Tax=Allocatelliglobosispora scoriae TaxID=643052 RepID=A0A841BJL4_9ACTN|nr:hypothetical protein [Allocatelliglobosispora scoriae]MBB5867359.1 hypothetical protein [Allocatelliglobosispora scoriae]
MSAPRGPGQRALVAAAALIMVLGACSNNAPTAHGPQVQTTLVPSAAPSEAPASDKSQAVGSTRPSTKAPLAATGPTVTHLTVTNIRCDEFTDAGGWIGYVDVEWGIARGDNVQLYGPKSTDFLGGYDVASTSATFQLTCEPNTPFLMRAVPQKGATSGTRRDYKGTWPNTPRTTALTATRGSCVIGLGDITVTWTSQGARGVRILVNGSTFPAAANGTKTLTNQICGAGKSYPVRVTAYQGDAAGGFLETLVTW